MRIRKTLSLLLSLVMLLSLMPSAVFAATSEGLYFRWLVDNNGTLVEDTSSSLAHDWQVSMDTTTHICVYYVDGNGVESSVDLSELSFPSFVTASNINQNATHIKLTFNALGSGPVSYTTPGGETFSFQLTSVLPDVGFYSSPAANVQTLLKEFAYSDTNKTFYLAASGNWTITSAVPIGDFASIANVSVDSSGKYATIQITGTPSDDRYYDVSFSYENSVNGQSRNSSRGILIQDTRPALKFRHAEWDDNNEFWYELPTNRLNNQWTTAPGYDTSITVYYVDGNGSETRIPLSDLTFSGNLSACNANDENDTDPTDDYIIRVDALAFSSRETISYRANGSVLPIQVNIDLPNVGLYTTTTPSRSSYLREFTVTDTSDTFYLAAKPGITINAVTLRRELADFASCTVSPDGSYATIQVIGDFESDRWYTVEANVSDRNDTWNSGVGIELFDGRSGLRFRWAERDSNRVWYEEPDNSLENRWTPSPGYSSVFTFYYVENGTETLLKLGDLNFSGNLAGSYANENSNDGIVRVNALDFGTGFISYTHTNGKTYSVHPEVDLPSVGFYSTTTPSQSSYLREFTVTDTSDIFYLAARSGTTINSVTLRNNFQGNATYAISPDGSYATIQVTGEIEDGRWYDLEVNISDQYDTWDDSIDIKLFDGRPSLKFQWVQQDSNGNWVEESGDLRTRWTPSKGYSSRMRFYFVENGTKIALNLSQLTADGHVLTLSQLENTADTTLVRVRANNFGPGTISYLHTDGNTYSLRFNSDLPPVGVYSTPVATQGSYLTDYTVTDTDKTLYLVARDNWELLQANLDSNFAQFASISMDPGKKIATITITSDFEDGRWYDIRYYAEDPTTNSDTGNSSTGLRLHDGKPGLKFRWAEWDPNSQLWYEMPGRPLQNRWNTAPGYSGIFTVYYVENGVATKLSLSDLSFSANLSGSFANKNTDDGLIRVNALDFGTGTISYTHTNGQTYSFHPAVGLPETGFYTSPTPSQSGYLQEFTVTDTKKTFYVAAQSGLTMTSVVLDAPLSQIATCTLSNDGTYAAITVTGTPNDQWYGVEIAVQDGRNSWTNHSELQFFNDTTGLYYKEVWEKNGVPAESTDIHSDANLYPDQGFRLNVYFGPPSALNKMPLSSLTVSGPITLTQEQDGSLHLVATGWGVGQISYNDGTTTHTVEIVMELPGWGALYKDPVRNTANFLDNHFTATKGQKSVYIMPGDGFLFDYVQLSPDLDAIADYVISPDRTYATLTITDDNFASGEYVIKEIGRTIPGQTNHYWGNSNWSIQLLNHIPDLHASVQRSSNSSGGSDTASVQLALDKPFSQDTTVSFQVALYDRSGRMTSIQTVTATIKAREVYVSPEIQVALANAATLKVFAIDGDHAPIINAWTQRL